MFFNLPLAETPTSFRLSSAVRSTLIEQCKAHSNIAQHQQIGLSEASEPIDAFIIGSGEKKISLISGSHSDEPVGAETLRALINQLLQNQQSYRELLRQFQFLIIPQINPDGERINYRWAEKWPDVAEYLKHAFREKPGRDLEFGYPDMRQENRVISAFLKQHAPIDLHVSLHGMAYSEGAMLLINTSWIDRTTQIRQAFVKNAQQEGLGLHSHDRKGEKGFDYIGPGFTTTPRGRAMQQYFFERDDAVTAGKFRLSSMEYVQDLGGDPLCLVTELPLFLINNSGEASPGLPENYLAFRAIIPELQRRAIAGEDLSSPLKSFQLQPLALEKAVRLQFGVIEAGIKAVAGTFGI